MRIAVVFSSFLMASTLTLAGCAAGNGPSQLEGAPEVIALSEYEASLGQPISIYGAGFNVAGAYYVWFEGNFDSAGGGSHPTSFRSRARVADASTLIWDQFGPFEMPFASTNPNMGTFYGRVRVERELDSGTVVSSEPINVVFDVKPSLVVRDFQPITASCAEPAKRALGGVPYRMEVQAVGFTPVRYTYVLEAPEVEGFRPISETHLVSDLRDRVGERGDWILPQVPEDHAWYGAVIAVLATDASGRQVRTNFAVRVHRPIEVFYNGNTQIAQVLQAQPVSGCMPGGPSGRIVTYSESQSETRTRSFDFHINEGWARTHSVSDGTSETKTTNEVNGVEFGTTSSQAVNWNVGGSVSGSLPLGAVVGRSMGGAINGSYGHIDTMGNSQGQNMSKTKEESETSTHTETDSDTVSGGSTAGFSWAVSSSESIGRDFTGVVIAGTYGAFYRQTLRILRRGQIITYNQCGASEVIGDVDFTDWAWAPDLALANSCPPLPPTNLPPAQCVVAPCEGS